MTRSILFPLAVPALLCLLWFAGWAQAFENFSERASLPPLPALEMQTSQGEKAEGPLTATRAADAPESSLASDN